jgi:hypothetical protein
MVMAMMMMTTTKTMMMMMTTTMISQEVGGQSVTEGTDYNSRHYVWDF